MVKIFRYVLLQVDDQEMRDGKGVLTIRDSCYHRKTVVGGNGSEHVEGTINH